MESPEQTKVSKYLTSLLPEVKTQVGINNRQFAVTAAIIFIAAVLVMLAYFSIKKVVKE